MANQEKLGRFVLWPNQGKSERAPTEKGFVTITCPHCGRESEGELAAWPRKDGKAGVSGTVSEKWQKPGSDEGVPF